MKVAVIGEGAGADRETIMKVYPRHKVVADEFIARGVVIGIGPLQDGGNLAIFTDLEAAEEFARRDPFLLEGLVKQYRTTVWLDNLLQVPEAK